MRKKSRFLAMALAVSLGVASVTAPVYDVKAAGDPEQPAWQDGMSEGTDSVVEEVELPEEDGEYIVYIEDDKTDEITLDDGAWELAADTSVVILETDLSAVQLEQLEELGAQEEDVYVEENIFLSGASDIVARDEEDDDPDFAEKTALKRALAADFLIWNGAAYCYRCICPLQLF